jgi:predicted nucleotidyltransferase
MIDEQLIESVKNKLIETYSPLSIYLFGSYAWGQPDADSDLDLLVIIEDENIENRYLLLVDGYKALARLRLSKDLLLYSQAEFEEISQDRTTLCYKIKSEGVQIYAKA